MDQPLVIEQLARIGVALQVATISALLAPFLFPDLFQEFLFRLWEDPERNWPTLLGLALPSVALSIVAFVGGSGLSDADRRRVPTVLLGLWLIPFTVVWPVVHWLLGWVVVLSEPGVAAHPELTNPWWMWSLAGIGFLGFLGISRWAVSESRHDARKPASIGLFISAVVFETYLIGLVLAQAIGVNLGFLNWYLALLTSWLVPLPLILGISLAHRLKAYFGVGLGWIVAFSGLAAPAFMEVSAGHFASHGLALAFGWRTLSVLGLLLGVAGVAALTWAFAPIGLAAPLFSRVVRSNALHHATRRQIADLVRAEPGIHFQEIRRRLALGESTTEHHLHRLVRAELLVRVASSRYTCFYVAAEVDRRLAAVGPCLKSEGSVRVLEALANERESTTEALARWIGLRRQTVEYHLARLTRFGVLEPRRRLPGPPARLTPLGWEAIGFFLQAKTTLDPSSAAGASPAGEPASVGGAA